MGSWFSCSDREAPEDASTGADARSTGPARAASPVAAPQHTEQQQQEPASDAVAPPAKEDSPGPEHEFARTPSESGHSRTSQLSRYSSGGTPARRALRRGSTTDSESGGGGLEHRHSSHGGHVRFTPTAERPGMLGERRRSSEMMASDSISLRKIVDVFYDEIQFMALAFGGSELVLEDHPHLNLRRIHWWLIRERGLTEEHWEHFFRCFKDTLAALPEIPQESRDRAIANVATTRSYFGPVTEEEVGSGVYARGGGAAAAAAAGGGGGGGESGGCGGVSGSGKEAAAAAAAAASGDT